jgi:mannose-1-phosphate guanylyltransferase/mannose-6-phosphate isomerase
MRKIWPVILAGGEGEDLWPLSRRQQPKSFLDVAGGGSLFRRTCLRLQRAHMHPPVVAAAAHAGALVREELLHLGLLGRARVVLEPAARGTGMAALAAAWLIAARNPQALMLVAPCDQIIGDEAAFHDALETAAAAAEKGAAVLLAAQVDQPRKGQVFAEFDTARGEGPPWPVTQFLAEMQEQRLQHLASSDRHGWNTGSLVVRADVFLATVRERLPQVHVAMTQAMRHSWQDGIVVRPSAAHWQRLPALSLVPEIFSADGKLLCLPVRADWQDMGDWAGLKQHLPRDARHNAVHGAALVDDAVDSLVWNAGGPLVALAGLKDVIAVSTSDAVLLCSADRADAAAGFAARLARAGRPEAERPAMTTRPWGRHQRLLHGRRFRLDLLHVRPQGALSLRRHDHHLLVWLMVSGRADVVAGEKVIHLEAGESVSIPRQVLHRLDNPGPHEAKVLELRLDEPPEQARSAPGRGPGGGFQGQVS